MTPGQIECVLTNFFSYEVKNCEANQLWPKSEGNHFTLFFKKKKIRSLKLYYYHLIRLNYFLRNSFFKHVISYTLP